MELEKIKPKFVTLSGTCKYCGQVRVVKAREGTTQEDLDKIATDECVCPMACKAFEEKTSYTMAADWLKGLCDQARKECKESRDLVEMWNKREALLVYIAGLITNGDIKGANIKLDFENSISFSMTSGGKLKIKSTYKNEDGQSF